MSFSPVAQLLLAIATASPPADGNAPVVNPPPATTTLPEPIVTKQMLFSIPFRIERPSDPSQEPREVRLFVSGDRGAHWDFYMKEDPAKQRFGFRAAVDGEYWFFIQTMDRSGQLRPANPSPGLRVIVDTSLPKLQLDPRRGEAGQVIVRWQIEEPNPKPDGLVLQYRTSPDGPWQPIAMDRTSVANSGPVLSGEVVCWPQAGSSSIQIRGELSDAAGNPAVSHASLKLDQAAGSAPALVAQKSDATWRQGAADPPPPPGQWPADHATSGPLAQSPPAGVSPVTPASPGQSPAGTMAGGPAAPATTPAATASTPAPSGTATPSFSLTGMSSAGNTAPQQTPVSGSVPANVHPPIGNQFPPSSQPNTTTAENNLPPGERPRMVNSRLFELEYDVDSVGPAGVARVELFGTRDGGRTWKTFALDNDNRSPMLVKVDEEGFYGFRVVVTSGANLGGKPPQSGDLPDLVIGVDLTKPSARIVAAEQGSGADAGKLVILWQAEDKMLLAPRPVSLYFSESPSGPWTPIATGLENTGRYAWTIDSRAPQGVFLRLEVRDEAGNTGTFDTTQSYTLDRSRPGVRIREIRPLGQSAQRPPQHYYFR